MPRSTLIPKRPAQPSRRVRHCGGKKNAPSKAVAEYAEVMRNLALDKAVDVVVAARKESTNGRIRRDTMTGILTAMPPGCTRDMIYNREKKRRRIEKESVDTRLVEKESVDTRLVEKELLAEKERLVEHPSHRRGKPQ
jgi:hypothetical protein